MKSIWRRPDGVKNVIYTSQFLFFFFLNNNWVEKSCQISPLLLSHCLFFLPALVYQICIFGVFESLYLTFLSLQSRHWVGRMCVRPPSFIRLVTLLKKTLLSQLCRQMDVKEERENDRRSMGHRGERMTSEARFSTTPPSVHSAETRQSLAGLQLLRLSRLLSALLCKCTHVNRRLTMHTTKKPSKEK